MFFKFMSYNMIVFFLMSIVVQFNDPDGYIWMLVYGAVLLTTCLIIFYKPVKINWLLGCLVLLYAIGIYFWSDGFSNTSLDAFMSVGMKNETQEIVRELWGLVICFVWSIVLTINRILVKETSIMDNIKQ